MFHTAGGGTEAGKGNISLCVVVPTALLWLINMIYTRGPQGQELGHVQPRTDLVPEIVSASGAESLCWTNLWIVSAGRWY